MTGNPIQRLLDDRHIPWRESIGSLVARHGAGPDPWFENRRDVVLATMEPPPFPGLLRPLAFDTQPHFDPAMPPLGFSGYIWSGKRDRWFFPDRARASLKLAREAIAPALGPAIRHDSSSSVGWRWSFGTSSIEITAFPPRLQHRRWSHTGRWVDPRAETACYITIRTGFRTPCTAQERAWIAAFSAGIRLSDEFDAARIADAAPSPYALEYVRDPFPGFERALGQLGRSPDGSAVIFATDQLHIVPIRQAAHVHVERLQRARGSGGAFVTLACRSDFGDRPVKQLKLIGGYGCAPDALNDEAARIAAWLGVPCILGNYELDD